jgi:hypothetical protein
MEDGEIGKRREGLARAVRRWSLKEECMEGWTVKR